MSWPPVILVAEDNDDEFVLLRCAFESSGFSYRLIGVANGAEALDYLYAEEGYSNRAAYPFPDLMLLDLHMPVLNGFEVLDWIKAQTFPVPMHVVVLSGSEHTEDKERAARLGAEDYLMKPIKPGDLHRLLHNICTHEIGARV